MRIHQQTFSTISLTNFIKHSILLHISAVLFICVILFFPQLVAADTVLDTFTNTAGTLLQNHVSDSGHAWAKNTGVAGGSVIFTDANRVRTSLSNVVIYHPVWTPDSADYEVSTDVYVASLINAQNAGVGLRGGITSFTGYYALLRPGLTNATILLFRGGNSGALMMYEVEITQGETHNLKIGIVGGDIVVYWDGYVVMSVTPAGGDIISTTGNAGMYMQFLSGNATGLHLDNFQTNDGVQGFSAGLLEAVSHTDTKTILGWIPAEGGDGAVTTQLQRSLSGENSWSNVSGGTQSPVSDTGLTHSTAYDYRVEFTDDASAVVYSNTVTITTNATRTYSVYENEIASESTLLHYWPMTETNGTTLASLVGGGAY